MKIEILDKTRYSEYNEFLLSCQHSLFYHSIKYKDFLQNILGCESHYLLAYDNNKIVAALPLMIKDGAYGKVINSLPYYGSNGGIIAHDYNHNLAKLFNEEINKLSYASLTVISHPLIDNTSHLGNFFTDERISQITNLKFTSNNSNDIQEFIFSKIDSSARRNIKKAVKFGIEVKIKNADALTFLEQVHTENMGIIQGKIKSSKFFQEISNYFQSNVDYRVYVAEKDGTPIAALLIFYHNKIVEYFTPVIKQEYRELQPLSAILFIAFEDSIKKGYSHWNWGGTWLSQTGVYQFKKKWGAEEKLYKYFTILKNKEILNAPRTNIENEYDGFYVYKY